MSRTCEACGQPVKRHRSEPDHRRFFGLIGAAFSNWPERHDFQPSSAEHLRAWLLCKAGHYDVTKIIEASDRPDFIAPDLKIGLSAFMQQAITSALKAARTHAFVVGSRGNVFVYTPKSIAWDKLSQRDFAPIRQSVEDVIAAEIGVDADTLLRQHERAA